MNSNPKMFEAAQNAAEFLLRNQITDRLDANKGRTLDEYEEATNYSMLTNSWQTGGMLMGLLAMYKRTGEQRYLDAADLAGHYLMSLQVMDPRDERYYGIIRECTPQSIEFCPRDATTAAWAWIWLYEATKDEQYLDRAVRFAEWHLKYGMCEGWPKWSVFMDKNMPDCYARGSFQSGTGLFYHDLFMQTGDTRYIEFGLKPIAENYKKYYFNADGSIILERRIFSNKISDRRGSSVEVDIHNYNDDFGNQMLQAAADLFKDESYRECARMFALWLARHLTPRHRFEGNGHEIQSALPMALMYFDELGRYYQDVELLQARDAVIPSLLEMQIMDTDNPRLRGAFESTPDGHKTANPRRSTNTRTTMYALIALLKLEGKIQNFWLGGAANTPFVDPLDTINEKPYIFKW